MDRDGGKERATFSEAFNSQYFAGFVFGPFKELSVSRTFNVPDAALAKETKLIHKNTP